MPPATRTALRRLTAVALGAILLAEGLHLATRPARAADPGTPRTPVALGLAGAVQAQAVRGVSASRRGVVALTFDDGPSAYTPQVLGVLRRHRIRATFFVLGYEVRKYPALSRRIVREGHAIANHSLSHPDMRTLSSANVRSQVLRTQSIIRSATGRTPTSFRFPYGASDARTRAVVQRCGVRYVDWNIDTRDWTRPGANRISNHIVSHVRKDRLNVVLMHDGGGNRANTVAALDRTIRTLKSRGYRFGIV
ncbi:hypothetical protein GCM10010123_03370 [Pilimelia anulata]|uniref:NodB homology domain-containing protein n=1 Tax=Pilimelia anulata TaxID=53371 RepID=A0A8J3FAQ4_9ACTN|nr:polysaccharide deacetylase family protein [Pilimelia anulata]GGJ76711.1 hypothetical protein GCM10010123_03370 [Pilimelia anulata]